MFIKIANLSDGDHFFDFSESVSKIGLAEPFRGNFKADVKLTKSHSQIILDTELQLPALFECDRCTAEFETMLDTSFKLVYLFSREQPDNGKESVDLIFLNPEADHIDISKELRDYALLAVPMKKLHSEDCKGLCPVCGQDLNIKDCGHSNSKMDPRWEPLMKLKKKTSKK